jgi:hypothetical protein
MFFPPTCRNGSGLVSVDGQVFHVSEPAAIVSPRLFRDRFLFEVAISFFVAKLVCRRARPGGLDQWRIAQIFLYRACGLGLRLQNKEYLCAILGAALYCTYFLCTVKLIY